MFVQAAAHVLAMLALDGHNFIPKNITSNARRDVEGAFAWTIDKEERHVGTCGHNV